ncbi:hypothetical protein CTI12_AA048120 [Artemisia annua]|uniref:Uncharacterized protein n=1 Tax=Artemisia annua TaxID=35608 RepID=A0A2U1Q6T4_ARTAN|nr:hypothetical protein CTI12_AA048120 [Artemisia annua]
MEIEPDIELMTLNEYLEYEHEKEARIMRNLRSRRFTARPPPPMPVYQSPVGYSNRHYVSPQVFDELDMGNMTIQEYEWYIANHCRREISLNHKVASNFSDCFQNTPDPQLEDMEIDDDAFMSEEFPTRSNGEDPDSDKEEIDAGCDDEEFGDVNHESEDLLNFPISPISNVFASVLEQDSDEEDFYEEVEGMDLDAY